MSVTFVEEFFRLFEEGSSEDHNASSSVSHLVVLTLGEFHHEFGYWVLNFHFFDDGCAVVGDADFLIWRD